jgi:acyl-coenzyme A thioesterase PaaI-like protein
MTLRQRRDSLTSVPFNTLLGMRLRRVHREGITIDCTLRNDLRNGTGVAHGGINAAMADAAVGGAIQRHFGGGVGSPPWRQRSTTSYP